MHDVIIHGPSETPADIQRLVSVGAYAMTCGWAPQIPALSTVMCSALIGRVDPSCVRPPKAINEVDAKNAWFIARTPREAARYTALGAAVARTWEEWHDIFANAGYRALIEFDERRPRLDRWSGDEDPLAVVTTDVGTHVRWPKYGLDTDFTKADYVEVSVAATILRSVWLDIVREIPLLHTIPPRDLGELIGFAIKAAETTPSPITPNFEV